MDDLRERLIVLRMVNMLIESIHNMFTICIGKPPVNYNAHFVYVKTGIFSEQSVYHENELQGWTMNVKSVLT